MRIRILGGMSRVPEPQRTHSLLCGDGPQYDQHHTVNTHTHALMATSGVAGCRFVFRGLQQDVDMRIGMLGLQKWQFDIWSWDVDVTNSLEAAFLQRSSNTESTSLTWPQHMSDAVRRHGAADSETSESRRDVELERRAAVQASWG